MITHNKRIDLFSNPLNEIKNIFYLVKSLLYFYQNKGDSTNQ